MKSNHTKRLLIVLVVLLAFPILVNAQRTKPRLRRAAPRSTTVAPVLVPVGTNLKVRLNDSLTSKESRAGDKFTATAIDPVRFNEATVRGHIRSIVKSGRVQGRTTMNLAFDSITLPDERHGVLHGYVMKVYGTGNRADEEGGVLSESRGKQTLKRSGIGATATLIVSQHWKPVTLHVNGEVTLTRAGNLDLFGGAILEGPREWAVRPVVEAFVEREFGAAFVLSGLVGAIWQLKEGLSLDIALRAARVDTNTALEVRAGLTWATSLWRSQ